MVTLFVIIINIINLLTTWLMELGGSMPHSQGFSKNPLSEPNNVILQIDTCFFKIYYNIVLQFPSRSSLKSIFCRFICRSF